MTRRRYRGNIGLEKGDGEIAGALGACIQALIPLPQPTRLRVLRGLNAWMLEDATGGFDTEEAGE